MDATPDSVRPRNTAGIAPRGDAVTERDSPCSHRVNPDGFVTPSA